MMTASLRPPAEAEMRRPYAPPSNIIAVLQRARSRNLPERVTSDFLDLAGVPHAIGARTVFALKFLGLTTDDGKPTDALRAIAAAGEPEYRELLAEVVRTAYAADFERVDPTADSQAKIVDAFARYQPRSQTSRMVITFLALCREAGIAVLEAPRKRDVQPTDRRRTASRAPQPVKSQSKTTAARSPQDGPNRTRQHEESPLFGVTEADIAVLDDDEFAEVWAALGKVARARARARTATIGPAAEAEEGDTNSDV